MKQSLKTLLLPTVLTSVIPVFVAGVQAQEDAGSTAGAANAATTTEQAMAMTDDAKVTLTGTLVERMANDDETYTFRDASGDITVEIDDDYNDVVDAALASGNSVTLLGEVEIDDGHTEIDVDAVLVN